MANPIDTPAANSVATLVELTWGTSNVARYAAWPSSVVFDGNTFESLPAMEVDYGKRDAGTKDNPSTIKVREVTPFSEMRTTHAQVSVTVWEIIPGDDDSAYIKAKGTISSVDFNYNENAGLVLATISGPKGRLASSLSLRLSRFCPWTFGTRPCGVNLEALKETGTISAISGQKITVSGLTTLTDPGWWTDGEVRYDGLGISIFEQSGNDPEFYLNKPPPADWVGKSVTFYPGCDGLIESCRHPRRNQESKFGGIGIKIPDRDPRIQ